MTETYASGNAAGMRNDVRLAAGISGLFFCQFWTPLSAPFAIGGMIDSLHLSAGTAGAIASAEVFAFSLVLVFLRDAFFRYSFRQIALAGLALSAIANLVASIAHDPAYLTVARILAGAGSGAAARAGLVAISGAARVDRMASALSMVNTLLMAGLFGLAARSLEIAQLPGLYWLFALIAFLTGLPLLALPPVLAVRSEVRPRPLAEFNSPLVLAMVAMAFGFAAVWAFAERIGLASGLTVRQVGIVIGLTALPGIFGGAIAFALSAIGREKFHAMCGIAAVGGASAALATSSNAEFYVTAQIALAVSYVFVQPFFLALAARFDTSGSLAASMTGWTSLVSAVAPAAAGLAVEAAGLGALVVVPLACTVAAIAILTPLQLPGRSVTWHP